jgi:NAD(P)-dependent dehydrogenase (short-subunit alcohol dehydrogenase family)
LITGASSGIGLAIARTLGEEGYALTISARRAEKLEAAAEELRGAGLDVQSVAANMTDEDDVVGVFAKHREVYGRLDALVNNAGVYGDPVGAADYDLDDAHEVIETNTFGPWRLIEAFIPLLRRSEHPRIVNVSSGAGQLAGMNGSRAAYRVSKAGLNALTRTLASDERWLKVNTMCPGWVRTDMGGPAAPRSVEEGADTAVWLATLPDDGPTGGFFRDRKPIPW